MVMGIIPNLDSNNFSFNSSNSSFDYNKDDMKKSLIIVDPQVDFISGNLVVPDGKKAMSNIISELVMEKWKQVIVTVDWHPFDHCSFEVYGGKWPTHCVQHTNGASIVPNISSMLVELNKTGTPIEIIEKGEYSGLEEYGAFGTYSSKEWIKDLIPDLNHPIFISGVAGDFCVYETTKNLIELGYSNITILEDCIASIDGGTRLSELIDENNLKCVSSC